MSQQDDVFSQWEDGQIESGHAIRMLASDLGEIESELKLRTKELEGEKSVIRAKIEKIMSKYGSSIEINGFGKIEVIETSYSYRYDKKDVDQIINLLREDGSDTAKSIATMLESIRISSSRTGGLRVTMDKKK